VNADHLVTAPVPVVVDLRPAITARRATTAMRTETYDAVTMSIVLMMLLDGDDGEARTLLADSDLTADEITALGEAGTRLGQLAPQIVRGRRR